MSSTYNSKLIDALYRETNPDKTILVADEMVEIGDTIFIYPIFSAYKRFEKTSVSHYFIADLASFKHKDAIEILKGLCADETMRSVNLTYLMNFAIEQNYYLDSFHNRVKEYFFEEIKNEDISEYDLEDFLDYFIFFNKFSEVESQVIELFENSQIGNALPRAALKYLLKYNSTKYLQHYYENYSELVGKKAEIVFTEVILGWSGGIIPKIREKISTQGSDRAQEILNKKIDDEDKKSKKLEVEKEKEAEVKFTNLSIIDDIVKTRERINILTEGNVNFGFPLLKSSEVLFKQITAANNEKETTGYCMDLREIIGSLNKGIENHGYKEEEAKKIIKDFENFGTINNLQLFLNSKKYNVDDTVFGLRKLNKVLSKLAHPGEEKKGLIVALKSLNLYDFYKNERWQELHKRLLETYRDCLLNLVVCMEKIN